MIRSIPAWRAEFRALFVFFTAALLVATHWPGLSVEGPIDRTDLVIHVGVFCVWTILLYGAGFVAACGVCPCGRRRLVWTTVAGLCFAVFDETTQPLFGRMFDLWDLAADCVGVLLAITLIAMTQRFAGGASLSLGE